MEQQEIADVAKGSCIRKGPQGAVIQIAVGLSFAERIEAVANALAASGQAPKGLNGVLAGWLDFSCTRALNKARPKTEEERRKQQEEKRKQKERRKLLRFFAWTRIPLEKRIVMLQQLRGSQPPWDAKSLAATFSVSVTQAKSFVTCLALYGFDNEPLRMFTEKETDSHAARQVALKALDTPSHAVQDAQDAHARERDQETGG